MPMECPGGLLLQGIQFLRSDFSEPGLVAQAPHPDATIDSAQAFHWPVRLLNLSVARVEFSLWVTTTF
jgi:hypothetical protein